MADLEVKAQISPVHLAIIVFFLGTVLTGTSLNAFLRASGNLVWLYIPLSGGIYGGAAYLMVKLAERFPGRHYAEYMPALWGRWPGLFTVLLYILVFFCWTTMNLIVFSRQITFFMFDRTPYEIIELTLLATSTYCALQDFGTILRVVQYVFFTAWSVWLLFLLGGFLDFNFISILPLWPAQAGTGGIHAITQGWSLFAGYEIILLLMPLVHRGNVKPARAVVGAFILLNVLMLILFYLQIGTLTLAGAIANPYPLMTIIRSIEIPGTFVERLDTYYLLFLIQILFAWLALMLYTMAKTLTVYQGLADHRPWVLALVPPVFVVADALHGSRMLEAMTILSTWLGVSFSLLVIPASYALARWKGRAVTRADREV